ncbi:ATP-binding cassette domain-containing protein [Streptomyces sp. NPDC048639]|uniref:ATP-binding cassette domain-containing protein n=1 Tax=Streptomyces sp. NPDC048639 TaxID=3365581 RepID=UPI0037140E9C
MDSTPHGAAVTAVKFGVKGPRGWAFQDIDLNAGPGSLIAVTGPSGSGRTSLLLALTGRMRPAAGHAEVAGLRLPQKMADVRRISALGHVPGVAELDPALTVTEHMRERALLQRRFNGSLRALLRPRHERAGEAQHLIDAALAAAGLDLDPLPKGPRTAVRDLERLEALRLSVALALIERPRLLAVDDTDMKLSDDEREQAWAMLRTVTEAGTTVLAVCSQAPEGAVVVSTAAPESTELADGAPQSADARPGARSDDGDGDSDSDRTAGTPPGTDADPDADAGAGSDADAASPGHPHTKDTKTEEGAADAFAETGRA